MKTKIVQIFEHESVNFGELGVLLSDRTIRRMIDISQNLRREFGAEIFSVEFSGYRDFQGVRAHQFAGVVQIDETLILEFLPKIYNFRDYEFRVKSALENLFFMLDYSGGLAKISKRRANYNFGESSIFETLIRIFAENLLSEIRKSPNFEYLNFEKNRRFLRGKLMVGENLKRNLANKTRFFTEKDEFTIDNYLNRIFKFAAQKMLSISGSVYNRQILRQILFELSDVSFVNISDYDFSKVRLTRLNSRFEFSLQMAKILLGRRYLSRAGLNSENFTIIWDMNRLFEEFVAQIFLKNAPRNFEIKTQFAGRYLTEERKFMLKPDIVVRKNGRFSKIIDTKYKRLGGRAGFDVAQSDAYQMFAYGKKFSVPEVVLLYPANEKQYDSSEIGQKEFDFGENLKLSIKTINLNRNIRREISKIENEILELL